MRELILHRKRQDIYHETVSLVVAVVEAYSEHCFVRTVAERRQLLLCGG